ncbi:MAG: 50S ribosomal protein L18 [Candidatus Azosocius agrarius]|nr:MAG: 50S ribosomal protein L18 [Gammaproteobacteria bacterium]
MKILSSRKKRALKIRKKIKELCVIRLTVYKTLKHIYAQAFTFDGKEVIESASSLDKSIKDNLRVGMKKVDVAVMVGELFSKRILLKGIKNLAFDRSGFKFHGRIKALADAIKNNGVKC